MKAHFTERPLKITTITFQSILQIKQLWLLFNQFTDIRDAFWNKQDHVGVNPVQLRQDLRFSRQLVQKSPPFVWDKASTDSSDCSDSHDQLSCAIVGLAADLRLPQVAEQVEDVVRTVLIWHCAAAVGVHVCSHSPSGRHHSGRGGAGGRGGHHHQRGGGGGYSYPSLVALGGLRQSPVYCGFLQVIAVHGFVVVQNLPLLVHGLPTVEDAKHRRSLVDN